MENISAGKSNKPIKILFFMGFMFISISLIGVSFLTKDWIQNLFLALGVNFFCSGFFYFVLAITIEKSEKIKSIEEQMKNEKDSIKRFSNILYSILEKTRIQFNELTNGSYAKTIDHEKFNDVTINCLSNLFMPSQYIFTSLGTSIIEAYNICYNNLVDLCQKMLFNIDFKFYKKIKNVLEKISYESVFPSCADTLVQFCKNKNQKLNAQIIDMIKNYSGDPEEDLKTNKYSGNLFLNVIQLYSHLTKNKPLFIELRNEIIKIISDDEGCV